MTVGCSQAFLFVCLFCFVFFAFPLHLLSSPGTFSNLPPSSYCLYVLPLGASRSVSLPCLLSQSGLASASQRSAVCTFSPAEEDLPTFMALSPPPSVSLSPPRPLSPPPSLPAVILPLEAECALIPVLCIIRRHDNNLCSSCVSYRCSVLHTFLSSLSVHTLARPAPEGRGRSAARAGKAVAAHVACFDFPLYSESSKHLLRHMLMCQTSRPPSGLHVRPSTQRL